MDGPPGFNSTIVGGPYDGLPIYTWGENIFLPHITDRIVSQAVTVVLGLWEFCCFFPAEIVLWRRIAKKGRPGRGSFAPWTTLALRYLILCFAVSNAFVAWSTTMPSTAACKVSSGFLIASGDLLNAVIAFAIAWRAQAVARGVIQARRMIRWMQFFIALLVAGEVVVIIFSTTWPTIRDSYWKDELTFGRCEGVRPGLYSPGAFPGDLYAADPQLWFFVITIFFNLACLLIVLAALRSLASRSRGFSKLITGMRNHSLFFFLITLLLSVLGIVWRRVESVGFIYEPITVIEAAVMVRILLAEQDAARKPMDTTFRENNNAVGNSRYPSTRGHLPTQQTNPRGDTTIQFADQLHSQQDYLQYRQHLQQMEQQQGQQYRQQYPVARPIYQPFSIMDNLGQAFSQVDSRNPQDLDEQSLDLSNNGSVSAAQNVYPGVVQEEMERQREMQQERESQMHMAGQHHMKAEQAPSRNPSDQSDVDETRAETTDSGSADVVGEEGKTNRAMTQSSRSRRPVSLYSASDRNYFHHSSTHQRGDGDDDDEEIGIQTVQF